MHKKHGFSSFIVIYYLLQQPFEKYLHFFKSRENFFLSNNFVSISDDSDFYAYSKLLKEILISKSYYLFFVF